MAENTFCRYDFSCCQTTITDNATHENVNESSTNMTQESYTVTAQTTDPAAANLILAAVIDEARRTGAQVVASRIVV